MNSRQEIKYRQDAPWCFKQPLTYLVMSVIIIGVDVMTGPLIRFPILFVVPVTLAAWCYSSRFAYFLAILLPLTRMFLLEYADSSVPRSITFINALVRIAVLLFMAYLVWRTARQTRELRQQVSSLVTICAWSRTIEFDGAWISFEEYLKRRFNVDTTHGISPIEAEKLLEQLNSSRATD